MSQILDRLWLCAAEDVHSSLFLRAVKATHVLSCAVECPPSRFPSAVTGGLSMHHIPLEDDENGGEPEDIVGGARLLHEWLDASGGSSNVAVVHCMAGISRSPTIVIANLILYKGMGCRAWKSCGRRC